MNRLTGRGTSLLYSPVVPQLKKKTLNQCLLSKIPISPPRLFFRSDQVDMTKTDAAVQTLADINPDVVLENGKFKLDREPSLIRAVSIITKQEWLSTRHAMFKSNMDGVRTTCPAGKDQTLEVVGTTTTSTDPNT